MDYRVICGILVALVFCVFRVQANFKYNISLAQMSTCRHYTIPMIRGYNYADFFRITHMKNNKLAENELLHLKFYVMTARDAHILLSVTDRPRLLDRVYEIVIGAGRNSFSTIRTNMGRRRVATNQEPNILSILDPTPIEIIQTKDADLAVYISGYKEEPLMNFTDTSPLDINYISFTTYDNIPASWFYDCQFDGFDTELEEEVRDLTPHQMLVENISAKAENASFPPDMKSVEFTFKFASVNYQQDRAIMQTRLSLTLQWNDPRLTWDPQHYGSLNILQYTNYNIWLPELHIINAALNTKSLMASDHRIKIRNNGSISLIFTDILIDTWCPNPQRNWPSEQLKCDIVLGLDQGPLDKLPLVNNLHTLHESIESQSEWKCFSISVTSVEKGNLRRFTPKQILQSMDGDIVLELDIARNGQFYKNVFSMPILACQILIILSFLLRGYRRGALILVVVFIQMLGLMFITKHAPKPYISDLMSAYQHILRIATFCYMWHICLMWLELYPPKSKPYDWLNAVMNYSPLRLMLCMRLANADDFIGSQLHPWREVAKIMNSLCFVVVNVIFILVQWNDPRLTWDPQHYGSLNILQYTNYNIWLPELHIINAALNTKSLMASDHRIKIRNNGSISLIFTDILINTWCPNPQRNWPSEQLKCDIVLGLDQGPLDKLPLVNSLHTLHKSIESQSEWKCFSIGVTSVEKGNLRRFTPKQILQSMDGDIVLELDIARNGQFYKNVFSMPILACQILIILSFLLRGYRRGALILVVVFIQMLGLMFITKHAPKPYIPDIMSAYQHILSIATFCYMWHICLMWLELYPPKSKPYDWLNAVMNYSPLRLMLCMRLANADDFIGSQLHPWREVAKIMNSLCFVVVNVIFILVVCFLLPHA